MDKRDMFVDDKAKLVPLNVRSYFYRLANQLIKEGNNDKAIEVLDNCVTSIPHKNLPYSYNMIGIAESYYRAGAPEKAEEVITILTDDAFSKLVYFKKFPKKFAKDIENERGISRYIIENSINLARSNRRNDFAQALEARYQQSL